MSIEQCQNFHREFSSTPPYREINFCSVSGTDMKCNSYSDGCPTLESFIPKVQTAPVLGSEELGGFPIVESLPPNNWELLKRQITDQAYENTIDKYNDQERMMGEMVHSAVEKHTTLKDHFKKDKLARVLAGGSVVFSLLNLGLTLELWSKIIQQAPK